MLRRILFGDTYCKLLHTETSTTVRVELIQHKEAVHVNCTVPYMQMEQCYWFVPCKGITCGAVVLLHAKTLLLSPLGDKASACDY